MWKFWVSDFWTGLEDVRVVGSRSMTSKMLHIKLFLMDKVARSVGESTFAIVLVLVNIGTFVWRCFVCFATSSSLIRLNEQKKRRGWSVYVMQQKTMSTNKRNKYRIGGGGEQSKMILKQGKVLLYSSTFFGRKVWNEAWAVLHADSQLYVYKDSRCVKEHFQVLLETSALMIAFGAACRKYQPSNFSRRGYGDRFDENCLIAIPTVDRNVHVHWLAATSESDLRSWLHCIAKTVEGRVLPPKLGKRPVAMQIVEELRATGRITNDPLRWEAYWLATMPDQFSNDAHQLNGQSKMNPYLEPAKLTSLVYTANCNLIETPVASQSKHQSMNLNQLKHHTFSYSGHEKFIS
ncbi:Decaprenylphosphoryl-beta-D-ribose oxidase [Trichinella spiralis]|uniref:Decaprenylphosphoryl-beta-D-ribose oxidase n=1 Tax=Trichinella spiralis TaxID=6334 RepID=A0ABR3L1I4_TRISP